MMDCGSQISLNVNCSDEGSEEPLVQDGKVHSKMPEETNSSPGTQAASKMRIDPLQLLKCLNVLLNDDGGIRSHSEVKRVAGLMGKYSKKLVSKCIYLNILGATINDLIDQFYNEGGWDLTCSWLAEAVAAKNWPLSIQILNLLKMSPVTVKRLKQNNTPKIVKELSRECEDQQVKLLSEQVVDHWKVVVGVPSATNPMPVEPSVSEQPVIVEAGEPVQTVAADSPMEIVEENIPAKTRRRKRKIPPQPPISRPKRKRGRPTKAETLSYAELLNEVIETPETKESPIKITIRNGPNLLAQVDSTKGPKTRQPSVESTDSDDNVPLSKLVLDPPKVDKDQESKVAAEEHEEEAELKTEPETKTEPTENAKSEECPKEEQAPVVDAPSEDSSDSEIIIRRKSKAHKSKSSVEKKAIKVDSASDKTKSKDKHRDTHKRDRDRSSSKSRSKHKSARDHRNPKHDQSKSLDPSDRKSQSKKDELTLNKIKPFSTDGLSKIPKKSPSSKSFLDALSAADSDTTVLKKPAVKTKSRAFRNAGLLDDIDKPPGVAGKRSVKPDVKTINLKRSASLDSNRCEKRAKTSVSSDPVTTDRPGGVKLMSPKRPVLDDDGGFMAALTAVADRKKPVRKRRSSETDNKMDKSKAKKFDASNEESAAEVSKAEKVDLPQASPTRPRPAMNFYKETLVDEQPIESEKSDSGVAETAVPDPEPAIDEKEQEEEEPLPEVPTIPAPAQEDYETIDVVFSSPKVETKGVLVYHRAAGRKKKAVQWKADDDLKEFFYFAMDENERENVNNGKFKDMMEREKASEKEMMGKNRWGCAAADMGHGFDKSVEYAPWKLYPIHLNDEPNVIRGCRSQEKHVQAQREHNVMGAFFNPAMLPDTPSEPDPEMVQRVEPKVIPLKDVSGADVIKDHRDTLWPEPDFNPPEPFAAPIHRMPHDMPASEGGRWVVGSQAASRFGAPMFNGANNPAGPPAPPFPTPFNDEFRGRWRPQGPMATDFRLPMMMHSGPPMPMGARMNGPPRGVSNPPRFKRNWGGPGAVSAGAKPCYHFMNGHCRNGSSCRFAHSQPR